MIIFTWLFSQVLKHVASFLSRMVSLCSFTYTVFHTRFVHFHTWFFFDSLIHFWLRIYFLMWSLEKAWLTCDTQDRLMFTCDFSQLFHIHMWFFPQSWSLACDVSRTVNCFFSLSAHVILCWKLFSHQLLHRINLLFFTWFFSSNLFSHDENALF